MVVVITDKTAKEAAQLTRDFSKTLGPAWSSFVGIVEDTLSYSRSVRQIEFFKAFAVKCREVGIDKPGREVSPTFLIPLLEKATLENNDELRRVWTTLLANAVRSGAEIEMRSAFVTMLSEMSSFDVTILSSLDASMKAHPLARYLTCDQLPDYVGVGAISDRRPMREDVAVSLGNLGRLGCILPANTYGGLSFQSVVLTSLGKAFIQACSDPAS